MKTVINYLIFAGMLLFCLSGCQLKKQTFRNRLIYNSDGTDALGNFMFNQRPLSVTDINAYVDAVANTQVTTFMMCSGSDFTYYRSKYGRILGDDSNRTLDCGHDTASFRNFSKYYLNHLNLEKDSTDLIKSSLRHAKEKGMEVFISYRMNDLHFNDTSLHCPLVFQDFWMTHPEYWINEDIGWHSTGALNFSHKEVRNHKLNIISEQLEKYGEIIDGYDLDFMRFIIYFKSYEGKKNAPLMTDLLKAVKAKIDELSAKTGKKILLSARVPPDLELCLNKGLDIKEWLRLGLLDFVSIGIHYNGNPALPVTKFIESLGERTIPVYASIDDGGYNPREVYSHGIFRGMASHILAQGGDGIYLFNYFFGEYMSKYKGQLHLEDGDQVCRVIMPQMLNELGSLKTLRKRNKIYCLDDGSSAAYGYKPDTPLPLVVSPESNAAADIYIGDDPRNDLPEEAIIFLRSDRPATFDLFFNGTKIHEQKQEYVSLFNRANNPRNEEKVYAYILPVSCLKQGVNRFQFHPSNSELFKIRRIEVALKYGDVKTNGYF
jgi:hypothetical protein